MADLANSHIFLERKLTPEQKLWKAVLSQGVYEACSEKHRTLPLTYGEMRSALEWIDMSNRDFRIVCQFAGYNPGYILRKAKNKINKWLPNGS